MKTTVTLKTIADAVRRGEDRPSILQNLVDAFESLGMDPVRLEQFVSACGETPEEYQPSN